MRTFFITLAALALAVNVVYAQNFSSLLRNCYNRHIERLNECVVEATKKIQPKMAYGIPELNLPRLEPLSLGSFSLAQNQGPVSFKADFGDLLVSGISRLDIKYLDIDHQKLTVSLGATLPGLTIKGTYKINGTVFHLPVQGTGPFLVLLEGVVTEGLGTMHQRNGQVTSLDTMNFDVKVHKIQSKVENLFGGNEVLQKTFTHFIEENSNLVLEEVRPNLIGNLDSFLKSVINEAMKFMPPEVLATHPDANKFDKHRARTLRLQQEKRRQ